MSSEQPPDSSLAVAPAPEHSGPLCLGCGAAMVANARFCSHCGRRMDDGQEAAADPYLGMVIAGRYRLEHLIGIGATGRVYKASQLSLGKAFAVKVLKPQYCDEPDWHERFAAEARHAARLNHPNVVSVVDHGVAELGASYLVMEFVEGRSLDRVIREDVPLSGPRIIDLVLQILAALAEAHAANMLHRDLKPDNILVSQLRTHGEHVKVLDFGIATLLQGANVATDSAADTQRIVLCGTPEYMSPEQARGFPLDQRADIYAVGVILYEMMTGEVPFCGASAAETLRMQVEAAVVRPRERISTHYGALDDVCMRALSKEPEQRFADAEEFRRALIAASSESSASFRRCGECQTQVGESDLFCTSCGAKLVQFGERNAEESGRWASPVLPGRNTLRLTPGDGSTQRGGAVELPFVGRDSLLNDAIRHLNPAGPGVCSVAIWGEAGVGKHRLSEEIVRQWRAQTGVAFIVRPPLQRAWDPLEPIQRVVAEIMELHPGSITARELGRANNLIGQAVESLPGLMQLFEIDAPLDEAEHAVRRRECFASIVQILQNAGRGRPVLFVFERIDELDHATREVLRRLIESRPSGSVSVLVTTSSVEHTEIAQRRLRLRPLSVKDLETLHGHLPRDIRSLVASGLPGIDPTQSCTPLRYALALRFIQLNIPVEKDESLADLIRRGLTLLEARDIEILHWIAVIGVGCSQDVLRGMAEALDFGGGVDEVDRRVRALIRSQWLRAEGPGEVGFIHSVYQDVLYEKLTPEDRRRAHQAAAKVALECGQGVVVAAEHELCADTSRGLRSVIRGAERCAARFDDHGAARFLESANTWIRGERVSGQGDEVAAVLCDLAVALSYSGRDSEALILLQDALKSSHSVAQQAEMSRALARVYHRMGAYEDAIMAYRRAMAVAVARNARPEILELCLGLSKSLSAHGKARQGLQELLEGLDMCTGGEGPRANIDLQLWRYLIEVAHAMEVEGRLREARMWCGHALYQAERQGRILGVMRSDEMLAKIAEVLSQPEICERHVARALQSARYFGDRWTTADLLMLRARLYERDRNHALAIRALDDAQKLCASIDWVDGARHAASEAGRLANVAAGHRSA